MTQQLNATCLAVFGEPVTFVFESGNVTLTGVFNVDREKKQIGSAQFNDAHEVLEILQSDIEANNIVSRGTVMVRHKPYQIIDVVDDAGGMAQLYLRCFS